MDSQKNSEHVVSSRRKNYLPPPKYTVSEWAERNLFFSERVSSHPGPFRCRTAPYVKQVLDWFSDESVRSICLAWGAQTSKTTIEQILLGYAIDHAPGPTLFVYPNETLAQKNSYNRMQVLINDCESLRRHKTENKDDFKKLEYVMDRMTVYFSGSNSPSNISSLPIRYLILDEIDKFAPASDREADAVSLAIKRVRTYPNHKILLASTPTTDKAPIWIKFLEGDQQRFHVPCLDCGEFQVLKFSNIKWEGKNDSGQWDYSEVRRTAAHHCENCGSPMKEIDKRKSLASGEWRPTSESSPGVRSAHLPAWYAPWFSFGDAAIEFLQGRTNNSLQDWANSTAAEPWVELDISFDETLILSHCSDYPILTVPRTPIAIILTVDLQKEKAYWVARAWCERDDSYLLGHGEVMAPPNDLSILQSIGNMQFSSPEGLIYSIHSKGIDARDGNRTSEVFEFCNQNGWRPLMGTAKMNEPFKINPSTHCLNFWADFFKDDLMAKLKTINGAAGEWRLPVKVSGNYVSQLLNERRITKIDKRGFPKSEYKVFGDNHYLDCETMQLALRYSLGINTATVIDGGYQDGETEEPGFNSGVKISNW